MTRYPLAWPTGWKRTARAQRVRAKFGRAERKYSTNPGSTHSWTQKRELTIADGTGRVQAALRVFGVPEGDAIISTNLQLRLDGLPRSGQSEPEDAGVAVYWDRPGQAGTKCMACDQYDRTADNLAAIAATLEAMRAIERHGGAQILDRAFAGFEQLPAPGQTHARGWREVLEVDPLESSLSVAQRNYRTLAARYHPDRGGDDAKMSELNWAWAQAQESLAAHA